MSTAVISVQQLVKTYVVGEVEVRALSDYDAALGIDGGVA